MTATNILYIETKYIWKTRES